MPHAPDDDADVPADVTARVRAMCLALPEVHEEAAWVGTRWRIRTKTFAHVLSVRHGHPPAYARAIGTNGPATVLMFRSSAPELDALRGGGHPFFAPRWRADEVGLIVEDAVDWAEVAELVTESYCLLAPRGLAARVTRSC